MRPPAADTAAKGDAEQVTVENTEVRAMERDPVCGMLLQPGQEAADCRYQDRSYHFCSVECRQLFERNPKEYIREGAEASQP
jgi:YHS domain-containing protein